MVERKGTSFLNRVRKFDSCRGHPAEGRDHAIAGVGSQPNDTTRASVYTSSTGIPEAPV